MYGPSIVYYYALGYKEISFSLLREKKKKKKTKKGLLTRLTFDN